MAILGNYSVYNKGPIRFRAGSNTGGNSHATTYGQSQVCGWSPMIFQEGSNESLPHISYPSGYKGLGWKMPLGVNTALSVIYGPMSGQTAVITITPTGTGIRARPGIGAATITITASGGGGLVVMGGGEATFEISASADIAAYLAAIGASTITITAEGDTLEAIGLPEGAATITITAEAEPMATGFMEGTTGYTTELTAAAVANAVWEALAVNSNVTGTMGELLNSAGAAADPLLGVVEGTLTLKDVQRVILSMLAGKSSGGGTGTIKLRDQSNTKDRIVLSVDKKGNRSNVVLDVD